MNAVAEVENGCSAADHLRERARRWPSVEGRLALMQMAKELEACDPNRPVLGHVDELEGTESMALATVDARRLLQRPSYDLRLGLVVDNAPAWLRTAQRLPFSVRLSPPVAVRAVR